MLQHLAKTYPKCGIWAFDPRWSDILWSDIGIDLKNDFDGNIDFRPWGLYPGVGNRAMLTSHTLQNGTVVQVPGELYTFSEITSNWAKKDLKFDKSIPKVAPSRISLLRMDWSTGTPCLWENEVQATSSHWWGSYTLDAIHQIM